MFLASQPLAKTDQVKESNAEVMHFSFGIYRIVYPLNMSLQMSYLLVLYKDREKARVLLYLQLQKGLAAKSLE